MTDILIRGLDPATVKEIETEAAASGLSRNEWLRRKLEGLVLPGFRRTLTESDWQRSAATFGDLADTEVMDQAWR